MTSTPRFVRWLPLAVLLAACSPDLATAPPAVESTDLMAPAGKKVGLESQVMEPVRAVQGAAWDAGYVKDYKNQPTTTATARACEVNSLEDLDGNDFFSRHADGFTELQVNEQDAFVMITEGPDLLTAYKNPPDVYVGRATWHATIWQRTDPVTGRTSTHSVNSLTKGVVTPLRIGGAEVSPLAGALLALFDGPSGYRYDLERPLLTPDAPATALVTAVLAAAPKDALRGVVCDWQQTVDWVKDNQITYEKTWPAHLNKLY